jgi:hypothetical protein
VLYSAVITYQWGRECRGYQAPDLKPATFPKLGHLYSVSPSNSDAAGKASQTEMGRIPCIARAGDEATIKPQPTRHVDYLSHDWKEEDIWSSWKYFVSHRLECRDSRRLENAMWRAWMKAKNKLKTVRPETLNWLKDSDVTWLYGPLQAGGDTNAAINTDQHFGMSSSVDKKTILKTQSISERILKSSYAGVVTPPRDEDRRDMVTWTASGCSLIRDSSVVTSSTAYGLSYPRCKRKSVHFSGQVEQFLIGAEGDGSPRQQQT